MIFWRPVEPVRAHQAHGSTQRNVIYEETKQFWEMWLGAFLGLVVEWKPKFVTYPKSTYQGLALSHACGAL